MVMKIMKIMKNRDIGGIRGLQQPAGRLQKIKASTRYLLDVSSRKNIKFNNPLMLETVMLETVYAA